VGPVLPMGCLPWGHLRYQLVAVATYIRFCLRYQLIAKATYLRLAPVPKASAQSDMPEARNSMLQAPSSGLDAQPSGDSDCWE
jgi:hypothetical protein